MYIGTERTSKKTVIGAIPFLIQTVNSGGGGDTPLLGVYGKVPLGRV